MHGRAYGHPGQLQRFTRAWDSSGHSSEVQMDFPVSTGTYNTPEQHPHRRGRNGTASPCWLRMRLGVRGALRGLRPSCLTQAAAAFIPVQDSGFQLLARAESPARGREHQDPPSTRPEGCRRPGTLQGPGTCPKQAAGAGGSAGAEPELPRRWRNTFEPHWAAGRGSLLPWVHPALPRTQNWMEQGKLG